ncbi:MAG: glycoside hydrolase family 9 protein [Bacteroidetes bacterium]|nr:glycoside hydrolase family 9 protein [Bacteroidota bacterium]MBU1115287.1 glycoside hydrolase family 9 protein [Bacteroidota bacterium]MBU1800157.1 glycoside hydrolase family 9 protein [Bacteroidota bacterium]
MKHLLIILLLITSNLFAKSEIFIRLSQVGFLPNDIKSGIILSNIQLKGSNFKIYNTSDNTFEYEGVIEESEGEFGNFKYSYKFFFSKLNKLGKFRINIKSYQSFEFEIGNAIYSPVVKELMRFFPIQRCGYTNPVGHEVCHIADATSIIDGDKTLNKTIDVTGGWHDAGDYVKFLNTTALTTYTLLFAYDFDEVKFGFDYDKNNVPDILEEAKVGLDWMLRAQTDDNRFITQVQNLQDHTVGWRLPENDSLTFNRPAYIGIGKNLIGIYSATMALASRIWKEKFCNVEFSEECLNVSEKYYNLKDSVPDVDSSGTGQYLDSNYEGKLALAAIELYISTKNRSYLKDAKKCGILAGAEYWWSYGNISTFAHYRLAKYDRHFVEIIKLSLNTFNKTRNSKLFGESVSLGWGSNFTQIGTAIQAILYEDISHNNEFDSLKISVRDYLLGKNQWGISFISNIGTNYSKNLHHQVSFKNKIILPGGFAAGPILKNSIKQYNLPFAQRDRFAKFQTDSAYYRDDRMDYVSNEPTIISNAMAIFLFGYFIY